MLRQLMAISLLLAIADCVRGEANLYVSVAGEKRIAVYRIAAESGELTHQSDVAIEGEPGALTTDAKGRFLFASIRSEGKLASFRVKPRSGSLEHVSTVSAGEDPAHLSTDRAGRFLFTAYYQAGKVTLHGVYENGSLTREPLQSIATAEKAHAIVTDPSNRFVFVPHTAPNAIFQFNFQATTGRLTATATPRVTAPPGTGPRHLVFHPRLPIAYVVNEQGGSVTAYQLDPSAGTLAPIQTTTTLPADFGGRSTNACAEIRIHPAGRFLYASNRGHDSIACFSIDEAGKLTAIGHVATEKTPRSFDLDPGGKFLYAAGEGSGRLASYRIDAKTGTLERLETYNVGRQPWWAMAVELPEEP